MNQVAQPTFAFFYDFYDSPKHRQEQLAMYRRLATRAGKAILELAYGDLSRHLESKRDGAKPHCAELGRTSMGNETTNETKGRACPNRFCIELIVLTYDRSRAEFEELFRQYHREIGVDPGVNEEKFLASVLRWLREPERWLLMARDHSDRPCGFSYFKVDRDDRPGWGYILEFFVRPEHRKKGLGRRLCDQSCSTLREVGVRLIWLTSNSHAEEFWRKCGFNFNGETGQNEQRVMVKNVGEINDRENL